MSLLPPKVLRVDIALVTPITTWDTVEEGLPAGLPYRYRLNISVTGQDHSLGTKSYTGEDLAIGEWIANTAGGSALRIYDILSQNNSAAVILVEDQDRYATVVDQSQAANAAPAIGPAITFAVNDQGEPILAPWPTTLSYNIALDLQSRFAYRNRLRDYVTKEQPGNDFEIGDQIYLDNDGVYKKLLANQQNSNNITRMVGHVNSLNVPGAGYFTFKPRGDYSNSITPALPTAPPGSLIYLDPVVPGKLTADKPSTFATPRYLRLDADNEGIIIDGSTGGYSSPLGYTASVYTVTTLTERDEIAPEQLQLGDMVYVADTGQGEWAHYIVSGKTEIPASVTWTKIVDQDSSSVDGRTASVTFQYSGTGPFNIARISPLNRITVVSVEVVNPFDITATLSIGDDANNERLASNQHIDLSTAGTYVLNPTYQYGGTEETWIRAYFNRGTSLTGQAKVTISYI